MKNRYLLAILFTICMSCSSTKNSMDGWIGKSKQSFIKNWGPAIRTIDNDKNGEVLIYADQIYAKPNNQYDSDVVMSNYWNYTYVYINQEGNVDSLRKEKQVYPPQQISAINLLGTNVVGVK